MSKSLSRNVVTYMAAQLAANGVGLVTGMILARVFSKSEMGDYQALMLVYATFSGILIAGLPSCLTYFYPIAEPNKKPTTVYIVLVLLFLTGMLLGLGTFLAAPYMGNYFHDNPRLGPLVRDFFLFYAFTLGGSYIRRFAVAVKRYRFLMMWLPFDRVIMGGSFAVPALLGYGLETTVRVAVWAAAAKFVMTTAYTMYVVPPKSFIWDSTLARKMLYYSLPLGLSVAVTQLSRSIDRIVVGGFVSADLFAAFSLAALALPFIPEIAESVMTVLTPELAVMYKNGEKEKFISIWQESIRKTSIIILGIFGAVEFLAGPLMVAMYSDKYTDSILYFRLYQVSLLVRVTVFGAVLQSVGKTRQILYASIAVLLVKSFLSVSMYKLFDLFGMGPIGPVVGSILMGALLMSYWLHFISKQLDSTPWRVWPWGYYLRILAAALVAGLASAAIYLVPYPAYAATTNAVFGWLAAGAARLPAGAVADAAGRALARLAVDTSVVAAARLVAGICIFLPAYAFLLHILGTLKEKDWKLAKDMTYGRLARLRRKKPETSPAE